MKHIYILLFLLIALCGKAEDLNSSIKIIQPLNESLYMGEDCTFVVKASKNIDKLIITQNNGKTVEVNTTSGVGTYCQTITLEYGLNTIKVDSYEKDKLIDSKKSEQFHFNEMFEGFDEDPEDYEVRYLHTDKNEESCKACHNMTSNVPTDGEAFEDVSKTTCYNCHQKKLKTRNTHAPAANWLCLDCHDGNVGEYNMDEEGKGKYIVRNPVAKTCSSCHEDVNRWFANRYTHGPVNDGRCERCHNPHGSDNEFFLRKPVWDLCTTCHAEKASGKHVVGSFVFSRNKGGHPTKDRKDPARQGRDFYCSSCHNPHGSSGIYLLRMEGSFPFNVCQRCHKK